MPIPKCVTTCLVAAAPVCADRCKRSWVFLGLCVPTRQYTANLTVSLDEIICFHSVNWELYFLMKNLSPFVLFERHP